jgi:hypothetical protein
MPFTNPVVGGTTLIRPAVRSPGYVAGSSGWSINKDGSAEFNSVTIRGDAQSDNYVAGSSGWKLDHLGNAEFNDVTIRGDFISTAASGNRVTMLATTRGGQSVGEIDFYTEVGTDAPGSITSLGPVDGGQRALVATAPKASGVAVAPYLKLSYEDVPGTRLETNADTTYLGALNASGSISGQSNISATGNVSAGGKITGGNLTSGAFTITPTVASQWTNNLAVTFPITFASAPEVVVTPKNGGPGTATTTALMWQVTGITTTGFNCRILRGNTSATDLSYIAHLA